MPSFDADQRKTLARAVAEDEPLVCPACGGDVTRQEVARPPEVSYVRHRVWLLCTGCRRSGAVDLPSR